MGLRQNFLDHVCKNPHDIGARLIYADWLDEQGDERSLGRAEFIRLCVKYHGRSILQNDADEDARSAAAKIRELLRRWEYGWLHGNPIMGCGYKWFWHRGFVESLARVTAVSWERHGPEIVRANPVWAINCQDVYAAAFFRSKERLFRVGLQNLPSGIEKFVKTTFIESPDSVSVEGGYAVGRKPEVVVGAVNSALVAWARS